MRMVLVADGRSPITRHWVQLLVDLEYEVTLVSTFPCAPVAGVQADVCMPVAFAGFAGSAAGQGAKPAQANRVRKWVAGFRKGFLVGRYWLGPLSVRYYGARFRKLIAQIQPDFVHALRIPFEGMLASYTPPGIPLAVSIWGNDLTLHAHGSTAMASLTRQTLRRADALLADACRDIRLSHQWGLVDTKPTLVVPGSGGIDLQEMASWREQYSPFSANTLAGGIASDAPLILNPRGFRTGSVRTDTFFEAIPLVLERRPGVAFACAAMAGQSEALRMVQRGHLEGKVHLLPHLTQAELDSLFLRAAATISISQHDGTPNSLLEAMSLGCFPIVGDIESLREWIIPGVNGLLVEPSKPQALAQAILLALDHPELRQSAATINAQLIANRAETRVVRQQVADFYQHIRVDTQ